ncbi:hypothetical protein ACFE04_010998 [Oxalis oulophora]
MASLIFSSSPTFTFTFSIKSKLIRCITTNCNNNNNKISKRKAKLLAAEALSKTKRRTRSNKDYTDESSLLLLNDDVSPLNHHNHNHHLPVMLGEVVDVFANKYPFRSFVDCTLGAAGHTSAWEEIGGVEINVKCVETNVKCVDFTNNLQSARVELFVAGSCSRKIIRSRPELQLFVGMDVDIVAHEKARAQIDSLLNLHPHLKAHTFLDNFKHVKSVLSQVEPSPLDSGVDGILMDLGMSSMQINNPERGFSVLGDGPLDMRMDPRATLKAEDILNSWPDTEIGRILRDYGEESNWYFLQNKIVQARLRGGLHTTGELVDLIRSNSYGTRGGRQGWIKMATRVFQALRIAVNDELKTLEDSLYACFDCLAPGGRLAIISFQSLEDRIVKKTFLNIIGGNSEDLAGNEEAEVQRRYMKSVEEKESWIRQMVHGKHGTILTKRPITPSEKEEELNRRCRSAKLRVIQKHHISKFLAHPSGVQSVLNTGALQNIEYIDSNIYRCTLSKLELFNFQAAPVIDLRVSSTDSDCTVELLSCKFIGSKMLERQNGHFSAFMRNRMTWDTNDSESFLELDVKLNLTIEVYTRPFTLLPASAVERPGNLMMQALVDRLVPLLMQQLLQDYDTWRLKRNRTRKHLDMNEQRNHC